MDKVAQFIEYLQAEQRACLDRADELVRDNRQDESVMAKIRANVFGIFATVSQTADKQMPGSQNSLIEEQIDKIPGAWRESPVTAELYGDYSKVMIESVKLDAVKEIKENYIRIFGGIE